MSKLLCAAALAWTLPLAASAQLDPKSKSVPAPKASASKAAAAADAPPRDYASTSSSPVDAAAGPATRALYKRLRSEYGKKIVSGQTSDYFAELAVLSGRIPVVRAYDMQNYSPHNPWSEDWSAMEDGTVKAAIDWYAATKKKGIVSFQWHWFAPTGAVLRTSTFYTKEAGGFDVTKAVAEGTPENKAVLRDIDAIAAQLQRLNEAGVPVLWRPLHEAAGGWFWWGAKGSAPLLKLYDLLYDRLTNHHKLHNLIWVWSEPKSSWYPGSEKVDIVGYDSYPGNFDYSTQKEAFDKLYKLTGGKKMVALTENGPIPDVDACLADDVKWAYFLSWSKLVKEQNSAAHIKATFAHPSVVTLGTK